MAYEVTGTGVKLTVATDVACHLWMRWSNTPWDVHLHSELVRGTQFKSKPYYCIVAYEDNEQEEAGDTLTHTFIKEPWAHCETRYFHFWGEVGGQPSPSESCLLSYHRVYEGPPPVFVFEYFDGDYSHTRYFGDVNYAGQTFTPQSAHHLTKVKLLLQRYGTPGDLHIEIYGTVASKPTGPILCSGTFPSADIPAKPNYTWLEIELGAGCDLAVDAEIATVAHCSSTYFPWHNLQWGMRGTGPSYERGVGLVSDDAGASWVVDPYEDLNFYEYGYFL